MKEELYLDTYILVNFLMNLACLHLSARWMQQKTSILRSILASLFGASYACITLFLSQRGIITVVLWAGCLWLMIWIAFGRISGSKALSLWGSALFFAFLFGGLIQCISTSFFTTGGKIGLSVIAGIVLFSSAVFSVLGGKVKEKLNTSVVDVHLRAFGKEYSFQGLCDSGNLLREPTSGFSVVLLSSAHREEEAFRPYFLKTPVGLNNLYYIPISTASGSELLLGFRPDECTLFYGKNKKIVSNLIIAAAPACQSFSDCDLLVPTTLL